MNRKCVSNWVDGESFSDRKAELAALALRLWQGTHPLLAARRRMCDTILVAELQRRLAKAGDFEGRFRRPGGGQQSGRRDRRHRDSGGVRACGLESDPYKLRQTDEECQGPGSVRENPVTGRGCDPCRPAGQRTADRAGDRRAADACETVAEGRDGTRDAGGETGGGGFIIPSEAAIPRTFGAARRQLPAGSPVRCL